jgi:hypothetical protein
MRRLGVLALISACGGAPVPAAETPVEKPAPDAAPAHTPDEAKPEPGPEPGSPGDVLGRVFDLTAREPQVPKAFGALKPGMTRTEAEKARPKAWGTAWEHALTDEPGVSVHATVGERAKDPVESLAVIFDQRGAIARLELAWGAPAARAWDASAVCWLAPAARLKACYLPAISGHAIELGTYVPLADALGGKGRRQLDQLARHLGAAKADIVRNFPDATELTDDKDPTMHRLEVRLPPTEFNAEVRPDRLTFFLDRKEHVREVAVRYGANDPTLRPDLVKRVRDAAKTVDVSVTIVEDEPVDIVVVLDTDEGLR